MSLRKSARHAPPNGVDYCIHKMAEKPSVIDLFCGCGGISWGLSTQGFRTIAGVDNWEIALKTFSRNHKGAKAFQADLASWDPAELADALKLEPGQLDVLVGGPPCQGFSKNVPASKRFLEDEKNLLVRSFLRFVKHLRPKVVLMENVAEIVNAFDGAFTSELRTLLNEWGYETDVRVLDATEHGVPQRRRRAFFFANRGGLRVKFPEETHQPPSRDPNGSLFQLPEMITVWDAIGDLPSLRAGEGNTPMEYRRKPKTEYQIRMRERAEALFDHVARPLKPTQLARLQAVGPGEGAKQLPDHLRPKSHYSGAYGRLAKGQIAPTITRWVFHPGSGRFGHPTDDRVITIREAARLQSFSDDFVFEGTYIQKSHQVGNAVPPGLSSAFAPLIHEILK